MRRLFVFYFLGIFSLTLCAQNEPNHSLTTDAHHSSESGVSESKTNVIDSHRGIHTGLMHNELLESGDSLTPSDYMMSIERVNDNLNSIRDSATLEFELEGVKRRVDEMTDDINLIRNNTRGRKTVINIKNLYLYQSFANNLNNENVRIQKHLQKTYNRVYNAKLGLKNILSDTVFHELYDNVRLRSTYKEKLTRLERKWSRTDSITKANLDTLNSMKVKIADNAMNLSSILNITDIKLDRANRQIFGQEVNFLWKRAGKESVENGSSGNIKITISNEEKAIAYYFSRTSGKRIIVLILGILLFTWLFFKRKALKRSKEPDSPFAFLNLKYLNSYPVLSLLLLLMCLMPFFDAYAPTSYSAVEYILLLALATVIFFRKGDLVLRFSWLILVALFIVDSFTYMIAEPSFASRFWMLGVQSCIIVFTFLFYKKIRKDGPYFKWIKRAVITAIVLSFMGILCNILGRFSLSGLFGLAAIVAVTQAVILTVFIDTIVEIVLMQLQTSRMKKTTDKPFDCSEVIKRIKIPATVVASLLWLIMLSSNLNIYHNLTNGIVNLLTSPITIGNISFKLVSVLWFFMIIWCAHILQRLISFLFGETGVDSEDTNPVSKKQHSRLLITRLLVLIGGYLLAIAASGLPIDKLTIIIGALGVGIGMGLQNVVNNFVSGIILIFDGSLQIGDQIEVNGQSGKVKEIGLRASTLSTSDGADVIIPNGNILSQNIVNWTFSNDQKRVNVWFCLTGKELDSNVVNDIINETIKNVPNVIQQKKPVILYTRVTPESCTISVYFWSTINNADSVKSKTMIELSAAFAAKKIQFD